MLIARDDWQPDLEVGWVNKPNHNITNKDDGPEIRFHLNADGLQPASAAEARPPGSKRIMIFGDSSTVGRSVLEEQRLAHHLKRQFLDELPDLDVICAGVQGYSTDQSLILMRRLIPRYRPDVVIHMMCDNDFGGNESTVAYGLAKPRFTLDEQQSLRLVPATQGAIDRTWSEEQRGDWKSYVQQSALYRLVRPAIYRLRFGGETDWKQRNMVGGAKPQEQIDSMIGADWVLYAALIKEMDKTCQANGATFILTQHPHAWEVWNEGATQEQSLWLHRKLQAMTNAEKVRFCGLVPLFLEDASDGPFHLVPRDPHCNGKGYALSARGLAEYIRTTGVLAPKPNQP